MQRRIYLDWNATAPLRPEARAAMLEVLERGGNASSVHAEGQRARQWVEQARGQVAALVRADPRNVTFTSGGTEANMLALAPVTRADGVRCERLLLSAIEHPSVLSGGRFSPEAVEILPANPDGRLDLEALRARLSGSAHGGGALVSVMLANNETGVVQPVQAVAAMVHEAGGLLHVDAVQGAGKMPIDINELGADLLTVSAHKLGGPQGAGALVRRDAAVLACEPLLKGGGQERGLRAGTENVPAIVGFGAAAAAAQQTMRVEVERLRHLRECLEQGLLKIAPQTVIFGAAVERIPNTVLFAVPGVRAETALIALDLAGVAVSSGSACSSGKVSESHVLAAMGVTPELARGAVRVSFGYSTTESDIEGLLAAWRTLLGGLLKQQGIAA